MRLPHDDTDPCYALQESENTKMEKGTDDRRTKISTCEESDEERARRLDAHATLTGLFVLPPRERMTAQVEEKRE